MIDLKKHRYVDLEQGNFFKTVEGDLIEMAKDGQFDVIIHGCNCHHIMGGGIARTIAQEFPNAPKIDRGTSYGDYLKLGTISIASYERADGTTLIIINGYTQFGVSADKHPYNPSVAVDYNSIARVFRRMVKYSPEKSLGIGFPLIGAGLAGGNWDLIRQIINEQLDSLDNRHTWTLVKFVNQWSTL